MRRALPLLLVCAVGCGDNERVCEPAPAPALVPCTGRCNDMVVVAHEDDDLVFINPAIQQALDTGHSVLTVYVTAGDLGKPQRDQYWQDRERGILAAYAYMLGETDEPAYAPPPAIGNLWSRIPEDVGALHFDRFHATSSGRDVDLIFLRLGDFQTQCLWENTNGCSTLNPNPPAPPYVAFTRACPGNATEYACTPQPEGSLTREQLIAGLTQLMVMRDVDRVATTDSSGLHFDILGEPKALPGYSEHWDHYFVGLFTVTALMRAQAQTAHPIDFTEYRGYTISRTPATLDNATARRKLDTFAHYAIFDDDVIKETRREEFAECPENVLRDDYGLASRGSWPRRQDPSASRNTSGDVKLRNGLACLTLDSAGLALADCSQATAWTVGTSRQLCASGTDQCLTAAASGAHIDTPTPLCGRMPCTPVPRVFPPDPVELAAYAPGSEYQVFYILDSGQIRTSEGRCLAADNGQIVTADCAAARAGGHVADRPIEAQRWSVE